MGTEAEDGGRKDSPVQPSEEAGPASTLTWTSGL